MASEGIQKSLTQMTSFFNKQPKSPDTLTGVQPSSKLNENLDITKISKSLEDIQKLASQLKELETKLNDT
jgi:hypothetical protein